MPTSSPPTPVFFCSPFPQIPEASESIPQFSEKDMLTNLQVSKDGWKAGNVLLLQKSGKFGTRQFLDEKMLCACQGQGSRVLKHYCCSLFSEFLKDG